MGHSPALGATNRPEILRPCSSYHYLPHLPPTQGNPLLDGRRFPIPETGSTNLVGGDDLANILAFVLGTGPGGIGIVPGESSRLGAGPGVLADANANEGPTTTFEDLQLQPHYAYHPQGYPGQWRGPELQSSRAATSELPIASTQQGNPALATALAAMTPWSMVTASTTGTAGRLGGSDAIPDQFRRYTLSNVRSVVGVVVGRDLENTPQQNPAAARATPASDFLLPPEEIRPQPNTTRPDDDDLYSPSWVRGTGKDKREGLCPHCGKWFVLRRSQYW